MSTTPPPMAVRTAAFYRGCWQMAMQRDKGLTREALERVTDEEVAAQRLTRETVTALISELYRATRQPADYYHLAYELAQLRDAGLSPHEALWRFCRVGPEELTPQGRAFFETIWGGG